MTELATEDINVDELRGKRLGHILVKMDKITRDQVQEALEVQKEKRGPLGQILVDLGHINDATLTLALAFQAGMEYVNLQGIEVPEEVIKQIPSQMANAYKILPLEYDDASKHLVVALASADNFRATDDLRTLMDFDVVAKIADPDLLSTALMKYYDVEPESIGDLINEIAGDEQLAVLEDRPWQKMDNDVAEAAVIVKIAEFQRGG